MADRRSKKPARSKAVTRTGRWKPVFLKTLADTGNVTLAATAANIERQTVYATKERDKAFAAAMSEAIEKAADNLEGALYARGLNGVAKYKTNEGVLVTVPVDKDGNVVTRDDPAFVKNVPLVEREYDTTAAIFLLKGMRPGKYRDSHHHHHDGLDKLKPADGQAEADALRAELLKLAGAAGTAAKG